MKGPKPNKKHITALLMAWKVTKSSVGQLCLVKHRLDHEFWAQTPK